MTTTGTARTEEKPTARRIKCVPSGTQEKLKLPQINTKDKPQEPTHNQPKLSVHVRLPQVKKFVSKYRDRSNGGIPIFSEERIKERQDKVCICHVLVSSQL